MRYFEDVKVGAVDRFGSYAVTREEVVEFASRYDPQPFHLSDEAAAQTHFGRLAASGWHSCAMAMSMIVENFKVAEHAGLGSPGIDELRWLRPVYPGDRLTVCGTIIDKNFSDDTVKNLVKVSQSAQPYIAEGGDSGGPVFAWSADGSMVHPIGIMKGTGRNASGTPCRNTSSNASANTTCFFVFTPLTTIRAYSPFTVNTTGGFVAP